MGAAHVIGAKKTDPLKPLFEAMDSKYEYHKIRLALTIWEKEQR